MGNLARVFSFALVLGSLTGCAVDANDDTHQDGDRVGSSAEALTINGSGYAFVQANGALGVPYAYDSRGGSVISSRLATGQYQVDFNAIPYLSTTAAHVVAYGGNAQCKLFTTPLGNGVKTTVYVLCFTPTGAPVDSAFVATIDVRSGTSSWQGAFATVLAGTSPSLSGSWNSTGAANSVSWNAASSQYDVSFPGLTTANAGVHVTALGGNPNRCKVLGWGTGLVHVKCWDPSGNAVAPGFTISYLPGGGQIPGNTGGHAWIDHGTPNASYTATIDESSGCLAPATLTATASGTNLSISISNVLQGGSPSDAFPMVTAYGSSKVYCSIASWGSSGDTTRANVTCYDELGMAVTPGTTQLDFSMTTNKYPAPC